MNPGTSLTDAIRLWSTPNVPNGGRTLSPETVANRGNTAKGKRQVGLGDEVKNWSTPTQGDWKGEDIPGRNDSPSLPDQVMRRAGDDGSPRVVLNPGFVEALMGFPPGWTVCEPLETPWFLPRPQKPSDSLWGEP